MSVFAAVSTDPRDVAAERARRSEIWERLCARFPDGKNVEAASITELRIARGNTGIFFDKDMTASASAPSGIAVSIFWSESYGELPPDGDRFEYSYPITNRVVARNSNEINAVKITRKLCLPLFLIDAYTHHRVRQVHPVWIVDWDDNAKNFLVSLAPPTAADSVPVDERPFNLTRTRNARRGTSIIRPGQGQFRFDCFKMYGERCAVCSIAVRPMLEACHLCAHSFSGADDDRNGLVYCRSHHAAFDAGLFAINPATLNVEILDERYTYESLHLEKTSIAHLARRPHALALKWAYDNAMTLQRKRTPEKRERRKKLHR